MSSKYQDLVVDVDSHWEVSTSGPGFFPVEGYEDELPGDLGSIAHALAGDVLAAMPAERHPANESLLAHLTTFNPDGVARIHPPHDSRADERLAWMDAVGIDHELVNPGNYWQLVAKLGPTRAQASRECNDFLAAALARHSERLHGVAIVELRDLDATIDELARVRQQGFRGFFLTTEHGRPPNDTPFGNPAWDPLWSATVELGMVAVVHVGNTSADFTGWADIGWDEPGGSGYGGLLRLANSHRLLVAQMLIGSMLFGGVFHRHPALTVVVEELWSGWLPWFVGRLDDTTKPNPIFGPWPYEMTGGEMLRRNLRLTPLPAFGDPETLSVLHALPEMVVFSSDFPHLEGNADPIALYEPELSALAPDLRANFLGNTMAESFARTGDPLEAID
jgi:predicted TIM-barrel fold metal-dependent hydrolase